MFVTKNIGICILWKVGKETRKEREQNRKKRKKRCGVHFPGTKKGRFLQLREKMRGSKFDLFNKCVSKFESSFTFLFSSPYFGHLRHCVNSFLCSIGSSNSSVDELPDW